MSQKIKFVRAVEERLIGIMPPDLVRKTIDEIIKELQAYTLTENSTELVLYDNINERIINRYCACLVIEGKSEKTIFQYRRTIYKLIDQLQMCVTDIGPYDIRLFLAHEKSRGVSNRTLENTRANISAFFLEVFMTLR